MLVRHASFRENIRHEGKRERKERSRRQHVTSFSPSARISRIRLLNCSLLLIVFRSHQMSRYWELERNIIIKSYVLPFPWHLNFLMSRLFSSTKSISVDRDRNTYGDMSFTFFLMTEIRKAQLSLLSFDCCKKRMYPREGLSDQNERQQEERGVLPDDMCWCNNTQTHILSSRV